MFIKDFTVENFKLFSPTQLNFHPKLNFILGNNGVGKTSLLEALYTLLTSYSFSRQLDKDLTFYRKDYYQLQGNIMTQDISYHLFLYYDKAQKKKKYLLDNKKVPQYKILLEKFPIVFFTPFDIQNILGEPQNRRIFFDRMISYLNPQYYQYLKHYYQVLKERNHILKTQNTSLLEMWTERMLDLAEKIIIERNKYIQLFNQMHKEQLLSKPRFLENIVWEYKGAKTKQELLIISENKLFDEKKRQISLWGPHRDDICIIDKETQKPIKQIFSLGQIKWSAFYLKVIELQLMNKELGLYPPFLIDDVFSEIDKENQSLLIQVFQKLPNQIFSTSTLSEEKFLNYKNHNIYYFQDKGNIIFKRQ